MEPDTFEKMKYDGIYGAPHEFSTYGHSNHGAKALPILKEWGCESVLDVGCGFNEFVKMTRKQIPNIKATGVDFSCPGADVVACATNLPFESRSFEVVTSFDMLEHLLPEQVDQALQEFSRVSSKFIFSIAYRPSKITWQGHNLHPTVQPEEWWLQRINDAGGVNVVKRSQYILGGWNCPPSFLQ